MFMLNLLRVIFIMKPRVLFIRSGNKGHHPITQNQGDSLVEVGCEVFYYDVVGKGLLGYLRNLPNLRLSVDRINPDIIHSHYSLCGFLASLGFFRKPMVVSLMGSDVLHSSKLYRFLIRFFASFAWDLVIYKSEEMQKSLKLKRSVIIPNGVNPKVFYPLNKRDARLKLGWNQDSKIMLFASDPRRGEKNYALFKMAFDKVKDSGMAVEERCLKNLDKHEMMLYYNAADVLVLTSHHEGSPNVIKEAMFCNCPFVSVNVGDVHQWMNQTSGNALVSSNSDELALEVIKVFESNVVPENTLAIKEIDAVVIAQKLKLIYEDLILTR